MKNLLVGILLLLAGPAFAGNPISSVWTKHSVTNFPTSSWTTIVSAMAKTSNSVHVSLNSAAGILLVAIGDSGSETQAIVVRASENAVIPLRVAKGARVSVKAAYATVSAGDSVFDFLE